MRIFHFSYRLTALSSLSISAASALVSSTVLPITIRFSLLRINDCLLIELFQFGIEVFFPVDCVNTVPELLGKKGLGVLEREVEADKGLVQQGFEESEGLGLPIDDWDQQVPMVPFIFVVRVFLNQSVDRIKRYVMVHVQVHEDWQPGVLILLHFPPVNEQVLLAPAGDGVADVAHFYLQLAVKNTKAGHVLPDNCQIEKGKGAHTFLPELDFEMVGIHYTNLIRLHADPLQLAASVVLHTEFEYLIFRVVQLQHFSPARGYLIFDQLGLLALAAPLDADPEPRVQVEIEPTVNDEPEFTFSRPTKICRRIVLTYIMIVFTRVRISQLLWPHIL